MGCSTSSQTSAMDSTKPGAKSEETNGTIATVAANGNVEGDIETVSDQTSSADPSDATTTARKEDELQLTDAEPDSEPNAIPAGPPTESDASPETTPPESSPQVEASDSTEPKQETEETIASSE
ncbi:uncharacterized protein LOC144214834 [Stigmatopora nigra]